MHASVTSFDDLLDLEHHGADTYVGLNIDTQWGRVYGGQVLAQGLKAAAETADPEYRVHSLHAYFIRGGELTEPIRYEVDRIRNGRSFTTRRVVARQSSGAILNLSASFQTKENHPSRQTIPSPDGVDRELAEESDDWSGVHDHRRLVADRDAGRVASWQKVRVDSDRAGDPVVAACALAFASDDVPMGAAFAGHPDARPPGENHESFMSASLDHALWFHRPVQADDWLLYDMHSEGWINGRGLARGHVFAEDGTHVATVAQEVLAREI